MACLGDKREHLATRIAAEPEVHEVRAIGACCDLRKRYFLLKNQRTARKRNLFDSHVLQIGANNFERMLKLSCLTDRVRDTQVRAAGAGHLVLCALTSRLTSRSLAGGLR
jgi:hypothetical protein